jgi:hypothetical protein
MRLLPHLPDKHGEQVWRIERVLRPDMQLLHAGV